MELGTAAPAQSLPAPQPPGPTTPSTGVRGRYLLWPQSPSSGPEPSSSSVLSTLSTSHSLALWAALPGILGKGNVTSFPLHSPPWSERGSDTAFTGGHGQLLGDTIMVFLSPEPEEAMARQQGHARERLGQVLRFGGRSGGLADHSLRAQPDSQPKMEAPRPLHSSHHTFLASPGSPACWAPSQGAGAPQPCPIPLHRRQIQL